jgi:ribosomal-protein-alanine N-acetyltransferase
MEASASRIAKYREHEAKYGFSKWIILDRESGLPIGDAGFFHFADLKRVELGYRLSKAWWKRGVATEVAAGWIKVARPWYGFGKVYAYAHPIHSASLRVMQKVGFCYSHREEINGTEASVYSLDLETKPSEMESTHKTTERSLDKLGMTGL